MERSSKNTDLEIVSNAELRGLSIGMQNLLNDYGQPGAEKHIGQTLTYRYMFGESFNLTPFETDYIESEREVSVFSVVKATYQFYPGLYAMVWTDLTPQDQMITCNEDVMFKQLITYGIQTSGDHYIENDIRVFVAKDSKDDNFVMPWREVEQLPINESKRRSELLKIENCMYPAITVREYRELLGILTECHASNII